MTKYVIFVTISFGVITIAYLMYGTGSGYFFLYLSKLLFTGTGVFYYLFYFLVAQAYLKYFMFSIKDLA